MNRNEQKVRIPMQKGTTPKTVHLIALLFFILMAYCITMAGLMLLAYFMYRFSLPEAAINVGIIAVYVISTFLSSFICGKKMKKRKFIWGMGIGVVYFIILLLLSVVSGTGDIHLGTNVITSALICAGSGMLGGMLA